MLSAVERLHRSERLTPTNTSNAGDGDGDGGGDEAGSNRASVARNAMNEEMMMMMMSAPTSARGAGDCRRSMNSAIGFDILIAAGDDSLSLYSKGVFRIATVDMRGVVEEQRRRTGDCQTNGKRVKRCRPVAVNVNASCNEMAVLLEVASSPSAGAASTAKDGGEDDVSLNLAIFRTHLSSPSVLSNILTVSSLATAMMSLLDSAAHEFKRSFGRYRSALSGFDGKIGLLRKLLDDVDGRGEGEMPMTASRVSVRAANDKARREMHACLLHGAADAPALSQWLSVDLGEGGLRRVAKQVDAATMELIKCVSGTVLRDCGELLFRVGELKSLAAAHEATASCDEADFDHNHTVGVGYSVDLLERMEEDCLVMVMVAELIAASVTRRGCIFRSFFSFLLSTIRMLNEESSNANNGADQAKADEGAASNGRLSFDSDLVVMFLETQLDDIGLIRGISLDGERDEMAYETSLTLSIDLMRRIPAAHLSSLGLSATIARLEERLSLERRKDSSMFPIHHDTNRPSGAVDTTSCTVFSSLLCHISQIRETVVTELLQPRENVVSPPLSLVNIVELESFKRHEQDDLRKNDVADVACDDSGAADDDRGFTSLVSPLVGDGASATDVGAERSMRDGFLVAFKSVVLAGDIAVVKMCADGKRMYTCRLAAGRPDFTTKSIKYFKDGNFIVMQSGVDSEGHGDEGPSDGTTRSAHIGQVNTSGLPYAPWEASSSRGTLCDFLTGLGSRTKGLMEPSDMLCCSTTHAPAQPFLAVSERGIGLAVVGRRRVKIYDFEAEDDDDDDDDEEEEED